MMDSLLIRWEMPVHGRKRLRLPLLVLLVTAAVVLCVAAGFLVVEKRRHTLEEAGRANLSVARLVGFHTSYVLNASLQLLDSIAETGQTRGMAYFQSEAGKRFLVNRTRDYPDLQSMLVIDKHGQLLVGATLPFPPPRVNYADRDYFRAHLEGRDLVFGEQLLSRTQGRRGSTISKTIRSADGDFEGIALVTIEAAHFERMFQGVRDTGDEEITIFRNDGAIFARYPESPLGQRYPQASVFERAQEHRSGVFEAVSVFDEHLRVVAFEHVGNFPLVVVTSQVRSVVLAGWQRFMAAVALALLVAFGWLGLAGHYAFRAVAHSEKLQLDLARLAQTDPLTGLVNRRHFAELAEKEWSRALRYNWPLSLLMLDVDHFKRINDTYGHAAGDEVLRRLAGLFGQELRNIDIVARHGGEEFAIVLAQIDADQALDVAERLRQRIACCGVSLENGASLRFTASVGVAALAGEDDSVEAVMKRADRALYAAKRAGRNRVQVSPLGDVTQVAA